MPSNVIAYLKKPFEWNCLIEEIENAVKLIKVENIEKVYLSSEIWSNLYLKNGPLFQT